MKKILIIEDEETIRETTADFLSLNSFKVFTAKDGIDGIRQAMEILPDLIICDVMMPNLDGHQVLSFLRQTSELRNVPFVFLSAKTEKNDLRFGMNLGADDYLTKPFKVQELLTAVKTRLKRKDEIDSELTQKVKSIVDGLNSASTHEFNTSLNGILGFTNLLIDDFDYFDKNDIVKILTSIRTSGERLFRITRNILHFVQLQKYDNPDNSFPISELGAAVSIIEKKAVEISENYQRRADLICNLANVKIRANDTDLIIIASELIDNAFKFSKAGDKVTVLCIDVNNSVVISIIDKGCGFSDRNIKEISAFKQFDKDMAAQQGIGLGLFIAKRLTELNKGRFDLKSELKNGSEIKLTFAKFE